jgi:hypothetical protein
VIRYLDLDFARKALQGQKVDDSGYDFGMWLRDPREDSEKS